ncbi:MBL fold metallo-hydrolase [Haloarchaeobius sp. DFWS5]|uniref:MBL fold metallo-hydrolase n=1 Tax=Haloarchaeobius sp. DFWS5 TaxID=3446114 RepID=UPI003EB9C324
MDVTLLGTGSPIPTLDRAGTSIAVEFDDETVLVDCGPGTTHRCVEHEIHPADVETLFLTHNHLDHTADLFHFVVASWSLGREALTVYGPANTERLLDALYDCYDEDIAYRREFYDEAGIDDVEWVQTTDVLVVEGDGWQATMRQVDHAIETYAHRFETDDATFVFSADTTPEAGIADFAANADLLVQDACVARETVDPNPDHDGLVWDRLTEPMSDEAAAGLSETHCTPREAGEIAAEAGVDTLVLTHLLPYRDTDAMAEQAKSAFDGQVVVAEDGLRFSL